VLWVAAATISTRILYLTSAVILTRLLVPADFGLMAIAMSVIAFSQGTTQTGFESALIQKQDKPEVFLNTAWTFELIRYLVLFIVIFLTAPLLASFFSEPRAADILQVISMSLVFRGVSNIGVIYFRKNLDFHKQFALEIIPLVVNICVVIPLAFVLRSVWALVWASLVSRIVVCVLSYIMHEYRPRLEFNIKKAATLFNFGKWILGSSLLVMIREQGMTMFVGKLLGIPLLGFYNRAGVFSTMIFQQVSQIVWKVGYPVYSQLQHEPARLKQVYLNTLLLLTFIGIPIAGGFFVLSRDFVHLFLTDKWLPIVILIQILCLQAIFNSIATPGAIAFQAVGKPAIGTKISMIGTIILICIVYPLSSRWGVAGAVASLFFSSLIPSPIAWYLAIKVIGCSFLEFFKPVIISLINTGIMVFTLTILRQFVPVQIHILQFLLLIFAGMTIYLLVAYIIGRVVNYDVYKLLMQRISVLRYRRNIDVLS